MVEDIRKVVSGGYCVGCGACAAGKTGVGIRQTIDGRYEATLPDGGDLSEISERCPFACGCDEDALSALFFDQESPRDPVLGNYLACFAGYTAEGDFREKGSSGGVGSWLAVHLLRKGLVDAVIHVVPAKNEKGVHPLFCYGLSGTVDEIRNGAKSRYYPVELSGVMDKVLEDNRRFLFVGLPCFVKAVRLMQKQNPALKQKIPFVLGLVCGHLKTMQFADYYALEAGFKPGDLSGIDFRRKIDANKVSDYGVSVTAKDGTVRALENRSIFGTNWGYGFFKNGACDYCDDVLSELADVTIGDAWLPAYEKEWRGTNLLIVRNAEILEIFSQAAQEKVLKLDRLSPQDVISSQQSGIRHRRKGLSYRLGLKAHAKLWYPAKRVPAQPASAFGIGFCLTHKLRMAIATGSRRAFAGVEGPFGLLLFKMRMAPLVFLHNVFNRGVARALFTLVPGVLKEKLRKLKG